MQASMLTTDTPLNKSTPKRADSRINLFRCLENESNATYANFIFQYCSAKAAQSNFKAKLQPTPQMVLICCRYQGFKRLTSVMGVNQKKYTEVCVYID